MPNLSQRRATGKRGARAAEAAIDAELARQADEREAERQAVAQRRRDARVADAERHRFTANEVAGAFAVRDSLGWHRVVRVSAKSVTVATAYSWTDRIQLDRILEVKHAE